MPISTITFRRKRPLTLRLASLAKTYFMAREKEKWTHKLDPLSKSAAIVEKRARMEEIGGRIVVTTIVDL